MAQVKNEALQDIRKWDSSDLNEFVKRRDGWMKAGVVTAEEVNQVVKEDVLKSLTFWKTQGERQKELGGGDTLLKRFEADRDRYVELGVITANDEI
jgi:hypothetical protein